MSKRAMLSVDTQWPDGLSNTASFFDTLEDAQEACGQLGTEWATDGWVKRHECWTKGDMIRQKTIHYKGVEYVEEDGVDE